MATGLRERGLQPLQTVAVMLPTGSDYFLSFFGILLAGGVPVPIYPPLRPSQLEEHLRRHARLLNNAQTVTLITVPEAKLVARLLQTQVEGLKHVVTVADLQQPPALWKPAPVRAQDLAFVGKDGLQVFPVFERNLADDTQPRALRFAPGARATLEYALSGRLAFPAKIYVGEALVAEVTE